MAGAAKARDSGSVALIDAPAPPHSVEAEQAVLGGLLINPVAWDQVADVVRQEDFYRPDHQLLFGAIEHQAAEHRLLGLDRMRRRAQIAGAGGFTTELGRAGHVD